ncbi:MAG: hypothetical protein HY815_22225 [Candidatus Riflebacteria bacterium]|nr:hypothetical protein [Candidatus Riflebacteria bacterium]
MSVQFGGRGARSCSRLFVILSLLLVSRAWASGIGEQRILVIMARFPDVTPSFSVDAARTKYFDRLDRYVRAISQGKARVVGKATDWYTLPRDVGHYRISQHNLGVERDRIAALIQDSIDLVDRDEDFSRYSAVVISLGARRRDFGMMGLCGYPGMLGWRSGTAFRTHGKGQSVPGGVAIFCEEAHVGVVFHDLAHIMGGVRQGRRVVPCLYDHDLQAQSGPFRGYARFYLVNVGFFDPMSCHFFALRAPPPGVCAWTKHRLGWLDPRNVVQVPRGQSVTLRLWPLSQHSEGAQVARVPVGDGTYYLIENRQPIGPDLNLPSHGLLIYLCDDRVAECRHGKSPITLVDSSPSVAELRSAPFTANGPATYTDQARRVTVRVLAQEGAAVRIAVSNGK